MDEIKDKELGPVDELEAVEEVRYKEMSPAQMVARRFFRSRLSLIGLIMLVALFVFAFHHFIIVSSAPYDELELSVQRKVSTTLNTT